MHFLPAHSCTSVSDSIILTDHQHVLSTSLNLTGIHLQCFCLGWYISQVTPNFYLYSIVQNNVYWIEASIITFDLILKTKSLVTSTTVNMYYPLLCSLKHYHDAVPSRNLKLCTAEPLGRAHCIIIIHTYLRNAWHDHGAWYTQTISGLRYIGNIKSGVTRLDHISRLCFDKLEVSAGF